MASKPAGDAPRASDPAVAYDAAHATWLIATLVLGLELHRPRDQPLERRSQLERADVRRALRLGLARLRQGMGRLRQHDDQPVLRPLLSRVHGHRDAAGGGAGVRGRRGDVGRAGHGHVAVRDRRGRRTAADPAERRADRCLRRRRRGDLRRPLRSTAARRSGCRPGSRPSRKPRARSSARRRCRRRRSTRRDACTSRGPTAASAPAATGNTIVLSTSTDGATWTAPRAFPAPASTASSRGSPPIPRRPGRMSIVTYVRNSRARAL